RFPGQESKAAIELYPVTGKKSATAANEAGFSASAIPALLVEGDNRAGLGYATAQAIAGSGINIDFLVAQVVGKKYSAVFGFESDADAAKCAAIIRKATASRKTKKRTAGPQPKTSTIQRNDFETFCISEILPSQFCV